VPCCRQRLAFVPFGLHDPVWVTVPGIDIAQHVLHAPLQRLDDVVGLGETATSPRQGAAPAPTRAATPD
jgi:hypothetical protein